VETRAEDPALIIYTSGTTGQPKGALHAHRTLLGHLPGVEYPHDGFPQRGDRFWTPADWAWIGGLFDVVMPAWHHGVTVVAHRPRKFDPAEAMRLMGRYDVRNVFMPPTALKLLRASGATNAGVRLRSLASGGESLGEDLIDWGRERFGLTINEFYGQTECNLMVGNGRDLPPVRPGWTGTAIPGHQVAIVDEEGRELPAGAEGSIAFRQPDPIRTEVVKAVVVLKPGHTGTPQLASELQEHVRSRLAAHEYPRIVEFRAELPLTATGKIIRRALRSPRKPAG